MENNRFGFENITADIPVIGFTGALGSGCTYLGQGLEKYFNYRYCSLSSVIHELARENDFDEKTGTLQDIGNALREANGRDVLVQVTLKTLDRSWPSPGSPDRPKGIIVDGIRNTGEVEALRQFPNFFLLSIQAGTEVRKGRTIGGGKRFATEEEFLEADKRDRDEQTENGQQVKGCNDLSDIIVRNQPPEEVSPEADRPYRDYVRQVLCEPYISVIEHIAEGKPPQERRAKPEEALMTAAYVESRRSSCLKRKVGAVIASPRGDILSAGHNEVPEAAKPCIDDPRYGCCARDSILENLAARIKSCPGCGAEIKIDEYQCKACGTPLTSFRKTCPNPQCRASIDFSYKCPRCGADVFAEFVPGVGSDRIGRLLDMCRALHAEENAILNLCKVGTVLPHLHRNGASRPESCVLYSTTFPCNLCANKIVTMGIKKVVYAEPYTMEEAKKVLLDADVELQPFQGVKSRAYFRLYS